MSPFTFDVRCEVRRSPRRRRRRCVFVSVCVRARARMQLCKSSTHRRGGTRAGRGWVFSRNVDVVFFFFYNCLLFHQCLFRFLFVIIIAKIIITAIIVRFFKSNFSNRRGAGGADRPAGGVAGARVRDTSRSLRNNLLIVAGHVPPQSHDARPAVVAGPWAAVAVSAGGAGAKGWRRSVRDATVGCRTGGGGGGGLFIFFFFPHFALIHPVPPGDSASPPTLDSYSLPRRRTRARTPVTLPRAPSRACMSCGDGAAAVAATRGPIIIVSCRRRAARARAPVCVCVCCSCYRELHGGRAVGGQVRDGRDREAVWRRSRRAPTVQHYSRTTRACRRRRRLFVNFRPGDPARTTHTILVPFALSLTLYRSTYLFCVYKYILFSYLYIMQYIYIYINPFVRPYNDE